MNIELITFFIFSALLILTSIKVITSSNPVMSAINLVFSFFLSAIFVAFIGRRIFIYYPYTRIRGRSNGPLFICCYDA